MWGQTRVTALACILAAAGSITVSRPRPGYRGRDGNMMRRITAVRAWPEQRGVLVTVRSPEFHEYYLVSLMTGKVLWSKRQRLDGRQVLIFGAVSRDGKRVIVYYARAFEPQGEIKYDAIGIAATSSPDRVKRVWAARDPKRMLTVKATWSRNGDAVLVQAVEEAASSTRGEPYLVRAVAVDPRSGRETELAVANLASAARILAVWCPPVNPPYSLTALKDIGTGRQNFVLRLTLNWPTGFERLPAPKGSIGEVVPSRDGGKIALSRTTPEADRGSALVILRGDNLQPIWELPAVPALPFSSMSWNPQGTQLVGFAGPEYGAPFSGLWLIDVPRRHARPVGNIDEFVCSATWAPEGRTVVFSTWDEVMVFDVQTNSVRELWSPRNPSHGRGEPSASGQFRGHL
jgi:WD40 repeat protein